MQDGTVTTDCSHGRVCSVDFLPTGLHPELGTGVHAQSWTNLEDMFVPHVLGFLPPCS
jgi:hypothetical protein